MLKSTILDEDDILLVSVMDETNGQCSGKLQSMWIKLINKYEVLKFMNAMQLQKSYCFEIHMKFFLKIYTGP